MGKKRVIMYKSQDYPPALLTLRRKRSALIEKISRIEKEEEEILQQLTKSQREEEHKKQQILQGIKHFTFNEYAQIVIGTCVFGIPAIFSPDMWDILPRVNVMFLFYIHLFFLACVFLALNYEFRDDFNLNASFLKLLAKRFYYVYFSVAMVVVLLLTLLDKLAYHLTMLEITKNFISTQSVGLFGAVTFSFLKQD